MVTLTNCASASNNEVETTISALMQSALPSGTELAITCPEDLKLRLATLQARVRNPQTCSVVIAPKQKQKLAIEVSVTYPRTKSPEEGEYYVFANARFERVITKELNHLLAKNAKATLTQLECPKGTMAHGVFIASEGRNTICKTTYTINGETYQQDVDIKATPGSSVYFQMIP